MLAYTCKNIWPEEILEVKNGKNDWTLKMRLQARQETIGFKELKLKGKKKNVNNANSTAKYTLRISQLAICVSSQAHVREQ